MKKLTWMMAAVIAVATAIGVCFLPGGLASAAAPDKATAKTPKLEVRRGALKDNLFSTEIFGKWKFDEEMTKKFNGKLGNNEAARKATTMTFTADASAVSTVRNWLQHWLDENASATDAETNSLVRDLQCFWAGGRYDFGEGRKAKGSFAVMSREGTPILLFLTDPAEKGGKTDTESCFVQLASDRSGDKDILMLGGDHADEDYCAWVRDGAAPAPVADPDEEKRAAAEKSATGKSASTKTMEGKSGSVTGKDGK